MIKSDVRAALAQLEQDDPFARERYRCDPQFQADVNEHARQAREMAESAKADELRDLLQTEPDRRMYATDPQFRQDIERRATAAAIEALQAVADAPDETRH